MSSLALGQERTRRPRRPPLKRSTRSRPRGWALVMLGSLLALVVALTSCGVPTRAEADRARRDDVPFGLLDPDRSTEGAGSSSSGTPVDLYFYDSTTTRLVVVSRDLERTDPETVLRTLQEIPADNSSLPTGNPLGDTDVIRSAEVSRGLVIVDLSDSFSEIAGATGQVIALAEIVYTATARPGVGQVKFTLDGLPVEVPRGDGSLSSQSLTRSDYPDFAPEPE